MEFTYHPTQEGVLNYARAILEHGFKPGILIIDEGWQQNYGVWKFDEKKFPNPKDMVQELHDLGFVVMLWVVPWVACSGQNFVLDSGMEEVPNRDNVERFIRNAAGDIAIFEWWNGYSAMLDLDDPKDFAFLDGQLQKLIDDYGIDGFKFDGGSITEYNYPGCGYEKIVDQFMLGEDILVAPVVTPHTYQKEVVFPKGQWKDVNGRIYEGGQTLCLESPLNTLLWFRKIKTVQ